MSMSSAFDPSKGRAIPEDQVSSDGLELDEDPLAALGIEVAVVPGGTTDPTAAPVLRRDGEGPEPTS
ncbi:MULTISPECIES: hypothetical protein [unclassified Curtobacterium]|uniref:hypothetical protein n=1 Tax=unclassified Curtobacterium TaxID=257496 RepID=UPI000DA6FC7C|nr:MULTISPECIES: hypothetical protein [unclassified Curtobacterium]PZE69782.1 hypothetical protein DEI83_01705 [Curtobacterium sp. MCBD17_021]WIB26386.1 hypothetical protein DEJ18_15250 [Curtobacterium sp. MCSS17_015]